LNVCQLSRYLRIAFVFFWESISIVVIDDMLLIRVDILLSEIFEGWVTNLTVNSSGIEMS
jgi:hypothetical protein